MPTDNAAELPIPINEDALARLREFSTALNQMMLDVAEDLARERSQKDQLPPTITLEDAKTTVKAISKLLKPFG